MIAEYEAQLSRAGRGSTGACSGGGAIGRCCTSRRRRLASRDRHRLLLRRSGAHVFGFRDLAFQSLYHFTSAVGRRSAPHHAAAYGAGPEAERRDGPAVGILLRRNRNHYERVLPMFFTTSESARARPKCRLCARRPSSCRFCRALERPFFTKYWRAAFDPCAKRRPA